MLLLGGPLRREFVDSLLDGPDLSIEQLGLLSEHVEFLILRHRGSSLATEATTAERQQPHCGALPAGKPGGVEHVPPTARRRHRHHDLGRSRVQDRSWQIPRHLCRRNSLRRVPSSAPFPSDLFDLHLAFVFLLF